MTDFSFFYVKFALPLFPTKPPLKIKVLSSPPFWKKKVGGAHYDDLRKQIANSFKKLDNIPLNVANIQ